MALENLNPNRKYLNPKMETMPIEELRKLQLKKLKKQIKYCYDKSPHYYKKKVRMKRKLKLKPKKRY